MLMRNKRLLLCIHEPVFSAGPAGRLQHPLAPIPVPDMLC